MNNVAGDKACQRRMLKGGSRVSPPRRNKPRVPSRLKNWPSKVAETSVIRAAGESRRANDIDGRKAYANLLENNFLRSSMDATVTIEGDKGSTLRVKYIGFTRPIMFKLQEGQKLIPDTIATSRSMGFRKLIMWNGYDLSWTWDLAKS
jgi:hypothetical protein